MRGYTKINQYPPCLPTVPPTVSFYHSKYSRQLRIRIKRDVTSQIDVRLPHNTHTYTLIGSIARYTVLYHGLSITDQLPYLCCYLPEAGYAEDCAVRVLLRRQQEVGRVCEEGGNLYCWKCHWIRNCNSILKLR